MKKLILSKKEAELLKAIIESEKDNVESDLDMGIKAKKIKDYNINLSSLLKKIEITLSYGR